MKNKLQRLLSVIIMICLICGVTSISYATEIKNDDVVGGNLYYDNLMREQEVAVAADICLEMAFPVNDQGEVLYPDNFGGKYIDGRTLVINLTSITDEDCRWYEDVLHEFKGIYSFNLVDHSYAELCANRDLIVAELNASEIVVLESAIRQRDNVVVIGVDESQVSLAKIVTNNELSEDNGVVAGLPNIEVRGAKPETPLFSLTGGTDRLHNDTTHTNISVGIGGTYQGQSALLTCGHVGQSLGDTIRFHSASGALVGTVVKHNYYNGGTGDYEIIQVVEDVETTNTIADQYSVKGTYPNPSEGTIVKYYGVVSGYGYGTVCETNRSVTHRVNNTDIVIHGLTRMEITFGECEQGDSGAPFFTSSSYSYTLFAGILSSYAESNNVATHISFTPWTKIAGSDFVVATN